MTYFTKTRLFTQLLKKKSVPAGSSKNKSKKPIIVDVDMRFLIMLPESLLILLTISWYTFIKKL